MSKQRFDLIVFDWDGTISDSTSLIAECIQLAARELALPVPSTEQAKSVIGLGLEHAYQILLPTLDEATRREFGMRFRTCYIPRDHEAPIYAGIRELLEALASPARFLAVATGKPRAGLERAFNYTGLKRHFHTTRCGDEGFPKPHPEMLLKLIKFTGVEASRTLMIGDTTHDLDLAEAAGVAAVAVTYGAHPREVLMRRRPLALIHTVAELHTWLMTNA